MVLLSVTISSAPVFAQVQNSGINVLSISQIDDSVNPELIQYEQQILSGTADNYQRGYIPTAIDMSYLKGLPIFSDSIHAMGPLPSFYMADASPVKDQTYFGTCWAFTTYGSLESTMLTAGDSTHDFSEKNMVNRAGFDAPYGVENTGGNYIMSTAYLARWDGPVLETDDPYPAGTTWSGSSGTYTVQEHVQNVYFIPGKTSASDLTNIKTALMDYGAVYTSINTSYTPGVGALRWNYNPEHYAYYNPNPANVTDHAVTIVGWDDNFLASNFTPAAPGNGAFIVKNSWGTSWGNNGYFYISYYDAKVGKSNAVFLSEPATNAQHIYQYDKLGLVAFTGYYYTYNYTPVETNWFSNVFQANGDEKVTKVSFYAPLPGMQYTISVYSDPSTGYPASGSLRTSQSGTLTWPGYNTITLNTPVSISAGHKFSVVVKETNPANYYYNYNIPICFAYKDALTSTATGVPNVGYISADGVYWDEITSTFGDSTVTNCLKAVTIDDLPVVQFHEGSYPVNENDGTVTLVVDKIGSTSKTITVNYATANGTALSGINYQAPAPNPGTLSIAPSATSGTITIPIVDDKLYTGHGTTTFTVTLSSPANAYLGSTLTQATVTVTDQDEAPVIKLNATTYSVAENGGTAYINVTRANDAKDTVAVTLTTQPGTAGSPQDYTAYMGQVYFAKGVTSQIVPITINDDSIFTYPVKKFNVVLSDPTGGSMLGSNASATVSIIEDDPAPRFQFNASVYDVNESEGIAILNVTRINDALTNITVNYTTIDGTAKQGVNYKYTTGMLMFHKGEMSQKIQVPIIAQGANVSFDVSLSTPGNGSTIGVPDSARVNINNSSVSFTYKLNKGWNMISVPFNLTNSSVESFFPANVKGKVSDMWWYDHGTWVYYSGIDGYLSKYKHLTNVEPGKGYYVLLTDNVTFSVKGIVNGSGVPSAGAGWTLFGVKDLKSINATTAYPNNLDLWYLENGTWYYYSGKDGYLSKYPHLTSLDPGRGYWVNY